MFQKVKIITALLTILTLTSCSNTRFLSLWVEKNIYIDPIDNIMVIGVGENKNARRMFEDRFAEKLAEEGIFATTSYKYLPEADSITRKSVEKLVKAQKIDAVIVTHMLAIEEETVYNPPVTQISPSTYYGHYYNYYPTVNNYVQSPGYYSTNKMVKLETSLYDTKSGTLLWSAQSSTFNPSTVESVIKPVIKLVIKDLKKHKLLAQPK